MGVNVVKGQLIFLTGFVKAMKLQIFYLNFFTMDKDRL